MNNSQWRKRPKLQTEAGGSLATDETDEPLQLKPLSNLIIRSFASGCGLRPGRSCFFCVYICFGDDAAYFTHLVSCHVNAEPLHRVQEATMKRNFVVGDLKLDGQMMRHWRLDARERMNTLNAVNIVYISIQDEEKAVLRLICPFCLFTCLRRDVQVEHMCREHITFKQINVARTFSFLN
jgi:hypothetical protein